jgi:hypothetical protein
LASAHSLSAGLVSGIFFDIFAGAVKCYARYSVADKIGVCEARGKRICGGTASQSQLRTGMKAILKTTNPATLNFAEAILNEAGIEVFRG